MHQSAAVLLFLLACLSQVVRGMQNISVDDQNSQITYVPLASWTLTAPGNFDAGGAHMLTQDPNAYATFSFTGVAVYYMSSLWPYVVNTAISLDGGEPVLFDLQDHSQPNVGGGPPTAVSRIVAKAVGLENKLHTVRVSVGAGQSYAIMDMLIYTALDAGDTSPASSPSTSFVPVDSSSSGVYSIPSGSSSTLSSSFPTLSSSSSAPSTSSSGSSSRNTASPSSNIKARSLAIGLGVVCTILGLGLIFLAWRGRKWYLRQQTRGGPGELNSDVPIEKGPQIREYPSKASIGQLNDNPGGLLVSEPALAYGNVLRDYTSSPGRAYPFGNPGRDLMPSQYPHYDDDRGLGDLLPPPLANSPPRAPYLSDGASMATSDIPPPSFAYTSPPHAALLSDGMSTAGRETRSSYGLPYPQSLAYVPVI